MSNENISIDPETQVESQAAATFQDLPLLPQVQNAALMAGYNTPSPVQMEIIPHLMNGRDVLAQSQTGTGKTAAFAMPLLSLIDVEQRDAPQVLVLAPTRELAIQVSESFEKYAACLEGFSVATIYGGQSYDVQLRKLRQGVQVVVGTPGRVIDHVNRGTLDLSAIGCLVLDEADEMLNMGFLSDVQFVLNQIPAERQIALFSATLPQPIREISEQYLENPVKVTIKAKTMTADSIRQRALFVHPREKLDSLIRILESEETDGVIVFTKTKESTVVVSEKLGRAGFLAVALNGDMPQRSRERTIERLKAGYLNILVATDVAARGLDVTRISHVFNYDLPHDTQSYIHRIGRTGRAGRKGEAFIFLTRNQRGQLKSIEKATRQSIQLVDPPSADQINEMRIKRFQARVAETIESEKAAEEVSMFRELVSEIATSTGQPLESIAAAIAHIGQRGKPFRMIDRPRRDSDSRDSGKDGSRKSKRRSERKTGPPAEGMIRYRIQVGWRDGVKPGNIVGAIANEAGLEGKHIGPIDIHHAYSTIDLPAGMPKEIFNSLQRTWVSGRQLRISVDGDRPRKRNQKRRKSNADTPRDDAKRTRKPRVQADSAKDSGKDSKEHPSRSGKPGRRATKDKSKSPRALRRSKKKMRKAKRR